jgi:hypothetical protein
MHIHGNMMNIQGANLYAAGLQDRAAAAARAAEVRKRLLKSAQRIEGEATPEETLIGHWLDAQGGEGAKDDEYCEEASGRDPDFG